MSVGQTFPNYCIDVNLLSKLTVDVNCMIIFQGRAANRRAQTSHLPPRKNTRQTLGPPKLKDPPIQPPLVKRHAAREPPPAEASLSLWRPRTMRTRMTSTRTRTGPLTAQRSPSKSSAAAGSSCIALRHPLYLCVLVTAAGSVKTWLKIWPSWQRKSMMLLGTGTLPALEWAPPPHPVHSPTHRPPTSLPGRR